MAKVTTSIGADEARHYTTIDEWVADDGGGDGLGNDDCIGELYNDDDFDAGGDINFAAASRTLRAASGEEGDGTAGTGIRILLNDNVAGYVLVLGSTPCRVEDLEIDANGYEAGCFAQSRLTNTWYDQIGLRLLAHGVVTNETDYRLFNGAKDRQSTWCDCIGYDYVADESTGSEAGAFLGRDDKASYLNCVAHDLHRNESAAQGGVWGFETFSEQNNVAKNCLATDITADGSGEARGFWQSTTNAATNASSDETAPDPIDAEPVDSAVEYVDNGAVAYDLHLAAGADCIDAGTDLETTPAGVNIDIAGRDRDAEGDTWDVGAHEYVAAPAAGFFARRYYDNLLAGGA